MNPNKKSFWRKQLFDIFYMVLAIILIQSSINAQKTGYTPIVFVHGMLAGGDTWSKPVQLFREQGYPKNYLQVLDWNSLVFNQQLNVSRLDSLISFTKKITGSEVVNLVGHSAGGGICSQYLKDTIHAKNVSNYIHLASGKLNQALPVKTLNLYSDGDQVTGGFDMDFCENKNIPGLDHYEIATSNASFKVMFDFFNWNTTLLESKSNDSIYIAGKVLTLGANKIEKNCEIDVFSYDPATGKRRSNTPIYRITTDENGYWKGFLAEAETSYQFVVKPAGKRKIFYYRTPFHQANELVYLRTLPEEGMAASLISGFPNHRKESGLCIFSENKAIITDRDQLIVNGNQLATPSLASAKKTAIAFFLYDEHQDGESTTSPLNGYHMFPFLSGADMYFSANPKNLITIQFNDQSLNIEPIPSSEGIMVLVFD